MLTNALIAGALGAAYLTILVLQLNPQVPLFSHSVWRWYATLGAFYGVHLALLFYVVMLVRELISLDPFSPGWIGVRLLAWLSAAAAATAALLMWLNLRGLPAVFTEIGARRMAIGTTATTMAAVVLLAIAVAHYSFGRRGSRVGAALLAIAITGSLALPVAARGRGGPAAVPFHRPVPTSASADETGPRVRLLLLDGASLDYVWPRAAEGRLPNFSRLLDRGASLDLATIRPTQPDPVWAAAATGMYPGKNGVRSGGSYFARGDDRPLDLLPDYCFSHALVRLGIIRDQPNGSETWRARPVWAILGDYGISTGVVRWPLTYPVEPLPGFMLSDRFHLLLGSMRELDGRAAYPPELEPAARAAFEAPDAAQTDAAAPTPSRSDAVEAERSAAALDRAYRRAFDALRAHRPVRVSIIRYQALDTIEHYDLAIDQPASFTSTEADRLQTSTTVDRYYAYLDGEIGHAIDALAPGDLLLVVSGFGMRSVDPVTRIVQRLLRQAPFKGRHDRAPDGFLLAYGTPVSAGRHQRGSIVDVTPTILYFLGVPIGRDMDGYARADLFTSDFTAERPITFIPSHGR